MFIVLLVYFSITCLIVFIYPCFGSSWFKINGFNYVIPKGCCVFKLGNIFHLIIISFINQTIHLARSVTSTSWGKRVLPKYFAWTWINATDSVQLLNRYIAIVNEHSAQCTYQCCCLRTYDINESLPPRKHLKWTTRCVIRVYIVYSIDIHTHTHLCHVTCNRHLLPISPLIIPCLKASSIQSCTGLGTSVLG